MVSESRWTKAQEYERSFWESAARRIGAGDGGLSWYDWRSRRLQDLLSKASPELDQDASKWRVLEVGSGPVGIVSFLEAAERIAVDPLCDYYSSRPALIEHRSPDVQYRAVQGEDLPFSDRYFDLVILDNVIDHVQDAATVMNEINRVLRPQGWLYFTVNLHPRWGALLHRIVSRLKIDPGHPHTFTLSRARRFLWDNGFKTAYEEWQDYRTARRSDLESSSLKSKLKALCGLSEYLYTAVCEKFEKASGAKGLGSPDRTEAR